MFLYQYIFFRLPICILKIFEKIKSSWIIYWGMTTYFHPAMTQLQNTWVLFVQDCLWYFLEVILFLWKNIQLEMVSFNFLQLKSVHSHICIIMIYKISMYIMGWDNLSWYHINWQINKVYFFYVKVQQYKIMYGWFIV